MLHKIKLTQRVDINKVYMIKATVVIPTKNGGSRFQEVLNAVLSQDTPWKFEILVIDSGSTDGTIAYCETLPDVKIHKIPSHEFGHGKTRNLAISLARGEYIALITQDALPANNLWLSSLVQAVEQSPTIAGAFGRHLPYPNEDPYTARDLIRHFNNFLAWPQIMKIDDPKRYANDQGYRQVLHFFSNNNSCIRRNVWEKYPFPDVDFAEDQIWAKTVLEAGFGKTYAHNAVVYHSHSLTVVESGRRAFDESKALYKLFGYKMCPTFSQLMKQSLKCTMNDFLYSWSNHSIGEHLYWLVRSPFYNFFRQSGFYLGAEVDKMPAWLVSYISLDQRKKAGRYI